MKLWPHISVRWRFRLARQKVVSLKREVRTLKRLLQAEAMRNREREDELVSRVVTSHGVFGVQARSGPAYKPPRPAHVPLLADLNKLTPAEQEEHALWLRDAAEHGIGATQATQDFLNELMMRRQPTDEGEIG